MNTNPLQILAVTFTLLLTVATCSPRRSLPLEGPLALDQNEQRGEKVFMENCQRCHPGGEAGLGPAINTASSFTKRFQIRHGLGAMPAFDENMISDQQLENVLSYLKALKKNR